MRSIKIRTGVGVVAMVGVAAWMGQTPALAQHDHSKHDHDHFDVVLLKARSARPVNTQPLASPIPMNSIQLFHTNEFEGTMKAIDRVTAHNPSAAADMPEGMLDVVSSVRWNLPPGVVVVLYEDAGAKGEQFTMWGDGQASSLGDWDFTDKASRWAWYYVGDPATVSGDYDDEILRGAKYFPYGTAATTGDIGPGSMQLFRDKNFNNDMVPVTVTAVPAGTLQELPSKMSDSMTSARWNLPPGVVVTFYQDAGGKKQQASIWGKGEVRDVDDWDFNDKVSRWAWNYVGGERIVVKEHDHDDDDKVVPVPVPVEKPRPSTPSTDEKEVIGWVQLWDDKAFTGRTITVRSPNDVADLSVHQSDDGVRGFDNKATSVRWHIPEGWQAVLFDGRDYSDVKHVLLGTGKVEESADLDLFGDKVTSIRFERRP